MISLNMHRFDAYLIVMGLFICYENVLMLIADCDVWNGIFDSNHCYAAGMPLALIYNFHTTTEKSTFYSGCQTLDTFVV